MSRAVYRDLMLGMSYPAVEKLRQLTCLPPKNDVRVCTAAPLSVEHEDAVELGFHDDHLVVLKVRFLPSIGLSHDAALSHLGGAFGPPDTDERAIVRTPPLDLFPDRTTWSDLDGAFVGLWSKRSQADRTSQPTLMALQMWTKDANKVLRVVAEYAKAGTRLWDP